VDVSTGLGRSVWSFLVQPFRGLIVPWGNDMISTLVSKEDLRTQLALLESRMTIKLGTMLFTAVGLAVALFKVL
jgi:hypothetical protein